MVPRDKKLIGKNGTNKGASIKLAPHMILLGIPKSNKNVSKSQDKNHLNKSVKTNLYTSTVTSHPCATSEEGVCCV